MEDFFDYFFAILEGALLLLQVIAAILSRANRQERKEAKREGTPLPDRDKWTILFVGIFFLMFFIGVYFLVRWLT